MRFITYLLCSVGLIFLIIFLALFGGDLAPDGGEFGDSYTATLKKGDCIQNPSDGFIWRILGSDGGSYTMQAWYGGRWSVDGRKAVWGLPATSEIGCRYFEDSYEKVACPFGE